MGCGEHLKAFNWSHMLRAERKRYPHEKLGTKPGKVLLSVCRLAGILSIASRTVPYVMIKNNIPAANLTHPQEVNLLP